jgi:hypothetical protein
MKKCWNKDFNLRPNFSEIINELKEIKNETNSIDIF